MAKFFNPQLDYPLDALEPQISKETMEYHHDKHLQTYIDNLNKLIVDTDFEGDNLEQIIKLSTGSIFNNAAQSFNHIFFFAQLSPSAKSLPSGELSEHIDKEFGSFEEFKQTFKQAALAQFGSGWAWLSMAQDGRLMIITTANAETPINQNLIPLMTVDLWEHAYYVDYRNRRAEYLDNIWDRIDWDIIEHRYLQAKPIV